MKNKVQLITYVDRLGGGDIHDLQELLDGPLKDVFGAVHLLPFYYPIDGADAGFDPIDHTHVDPRLGGWDNIRELAGSVDVMADVIVNHVSDKSPQFLDFLQNGSSSQYRDLFLTRDTVFPQGASDAELAAIYRPRPGEPFVEVMLETGEKAVIWATFTRHQLDIDVQHSLGKSHLQRVLQTLATNGVSMVRLDAVGYAIKKRGTSCFMLPETYRFIREIAEDSAALGIEVLVEIHSYFQRQIEIASQVDRVYDFALPPLILHAFAVGTAEYLKNWIRIRPNNAVTVLDTHDGIGIVDIGSDQADRARNPGLVPSEHIDLLVEHIHCASSGASRLATGAAASNLDLYQVNCTFFDAMGRDERRYLLARAIQFFLPGIPQVYYVGLLAGHNDLGLLERSGVGRDINRHYYSRDEITVELERTVVRDLLNLIRLRNDHSAFSGTFVMRNSDALWLCLRWDKDDAFAELNVNMQSAEYDLRYTTGSGIVRLEWISGRSVG